MKTRTIARRRLAEILVAIVALLLAGSVALAQPDVQPSPDGVSPIPTLYAAGHGAASGGPYHLVSLALRPAFGVSAQSNAQGDTWQVSGTASGAGYRLLGPAAPASSENGCCCTYLPCLLRQSP